MKILKIKEVAELLNVPLRTMYNMVESGTFSVPPIPGTKPKRWNYDAVLTWSKGGILKTCSSCNMTKVISEFSKRRGENYLNGRCKTCCNLEQKNYNDKNRKYRLEKYSSDQETASGRAKTLFNSIKERCKRNKINISITVEMLEEKIEQGFCEKSGIAFDLSKSEKTYHNPFAPSVDRINPQKGYLKTNIQVVCKMYNMGKGQHTDEEFLFLCKSVVEKAEGVNTCKT